MLDRQAWTKPRCWSSLSILEPFLFQPKTFYTSSQRNTTPLLVAVAMQRQQHETAKKGYISFMLPYVTITNSNERTATTNSKQQLQHHTQKKIENNLKIDLKKIKNKKETNKNQAVTNANHHVQPSPTCRACMHACMHVYTRTLRAA